MVRIDSIAWAAQPAARDQERVEHRERIVPAALMFLALLHGLLYLAIVPPWQHYDEPTHFEYARLIAIWNRWPSLNEFDRATHREIADSMYRFQFWQPGMRPPIFGAEPPNIGFSAKVHPPLYYAVAAVPVRWLRYSPIEAQLYAARMVTVLLYVLVILCAWRITTILAPNRPALQIAAPLILILVPAFADQMSAVNNDALVNFSTAALLLGCVLLIRDGPRPQPLALAILGLAVAIATKRTAVVGAAPFALALLWSLRQRRLRWWVWSCAIGVFALLMGYAVLERSASSLTVRPWVADLDRRFLRLGLEHFVASFMEGRQGQRDYPLLFQILFSSFWLGFGWGKVPVGWGWEWALRGVTLVSIAGLISYSIRRYGAAIWQQRVIWLFGITIFVAVLAVVIRFEAEQTSYIPRGRYLHLAIVPVVWLLTLGFERLLPSRWRAHSLLGLVVFFALLDVVSWANVLSSFFYR
jgi:4-amino-4-deoxy-L-arabinose transferase-like glycosyltransferase